jgi:hypothetical protein
MYNTADEKPNPATLDLYYEYQQIYTCMYNALSQILTTSGKRRIIPIFSPHEFYSFD